VSDPLARLSLVPAAASSRLAPAVRADEAETAVRDFLAFLVAGSRYAIELSAVRKVIALPRVTEVPLAAEAVVGVISVRGRVTTLFDARRRLRLPRAEPSPRSRVLLVNRGEETVGLLVDAVLRVYRLKETEIEPPAVAGAERQAHVIGIGRPERDDAGGRQPGEPGREPLRFFKPFLPEKATTPEDEVLVLVDPAALLKG
jgi:purine-binding chemotaxis protein CheW